MIRYQGDNVGFVVDDENAVTWLRRSFWGWLQSDLASKSMHGEKIVAAMQAYGRVSVTIM
jgi:hypothetical protein